MSTSASATGDAVLVAKIYETYGSHTGAFPGARHLQYSRCASNCKEFGLIRRTAKNGCASRWEHKSCARIPSVLVVFRQCFHTKIHSSEIWVVVRRHHRRVAVWGWARGIATRFSTANRRAFREPDARLSSFTRLSPIHAVAAPARSAVAVRWAPLVRWESRRRWLSWVGA